MAASGRVWFVASMLAAFVVSTAPRALAQACHAVTYAAPEARGVRVSLGSETAGYQKSAEEGHYQALRASAEWSLPRVSLRVGMPAYRLLRDDGATRGIGDLFLGGRLVLLDSNDRRVHAGVVFAGTLPTGDADRQLGMGHVMLMPSTFVTGEIGSFTLYGELGYNRALASQQTATSSGHQHGGGHAHADGPGPIVDPMNRSEVGASLWAALSQGSFRLRSGVYGATPIAVDNGRTRGVALVGLGFGSGRFETSLEFHKAFTGDPFTQKLVLEVATRF